MGTRGSEWDQLEATTSPGVRPCLGVTLACVRTPAGKPRSCHLQEQALPVTWSFSSVTSAFR